MKRRLIFIVLLLPLVLLSACGGGDLIAPTEPIISTVTMINASAISVTWSNSTDNNAVQGYRIYRDGNMTAATLGLSYTDKGLLPLKTYCYQVSAYDFDGNESGLSGTLCAMTAADTTAPSIPINVIANVVSFSTIQVVWTPSTDDVGVSWYDVYRNNVLIGNSTIPSYTDSNGLINTTSYCYTVSAHDASQHESSKSAPSCTSTPASDFKVYFIENGTGAGMYTSIAVQNGTNGTVYVSYYDYTNGDLKLARGSGNSWTNSTVDSTGNAGMYTSMAINQLGNLNIAYYDATNSLLKYAFTDSAGLLITTATIAPFGLSPSLKIDSSGALHVAFYNSAGAKGLAYMNYVGGTWQSALTITGDTGYRPSLFMDKNNRPHISFYDNASDSFYYAAYLGVSPLWVLGALDSGHAGLYSSIVVDSDSITHIAYYDGQNGDLKYVSGSAISGFSSSAVIDSSGVTGLYVSMALDSSSRPHICYYDETNGRLMYATKDTSNKWATSPIDSSSFDLGLYCSIAIDSLGKVHISYFDAATGSLKYATNRP